MASLRPLSLVLFALTAIAQTPPPAFEAATIKPSPPFPPNGSRGMATTQTGLDFTGVTLISCIRFAYRVKDYQISGPAWLNERRFDILAKAPANIRPIQFGPMLQTLLADRFHLRIHRETKEIQGLALIVTKGGLKLKEASHNRTEALADMPRTTQEALSIPMPGVGRTLSLPDGGMRSVEGDVKMAVIAGNIGNMLGTPVFDLTGATGNYDVVLDYSRDDVRNQQVIRLNGGPLPDPSPAQLANPSGQSIYESLAKLGLKLESRKVPVEIIIVDSADKTPTEN